MPRTNSKPKSEPRKKSATAAAVAKLAGVSISAVSRVFTAGASVSDQTRAKVLEAAKTLKYRPSQNVQTKYLRGSYIIGIAVGKLDDLFYGNAVEQLSDLLEKTGHRLLLFVTHGKDVRSIYSELLRFRVDALILAARDPSFPLLDACRDFQIPVIIFNQAYSASDIPSVSGANFTGARLIAEFLVAGGHKRFAYIAGRESAATDIEREAGFNSFLNLNDLPHAARARGNFTYDGVTAATKKLLSARTRPDAIFCANDQTAIVCLQVAQHEFGLKPGKDISVVGFDDVTVARWPAFDLTSYSQPIDSMVAETVQLLHGMLNGEQFKSVHRVVQGELIVRRSARVPKAGVRTRADGVKVFSGA